MLSAAILLLGVFLFPIWKITLYAPQYPDGMQMFIWIYQITGDTPHTLQNVNILNHYIGMKFIEPDSIPELKYFPHIVMAMVFLGLVTGLTKKKSLYWSWASLLIILGALGIYDFYLWEYDYGHNLDPNAPIKIPGMAFQPPVIGNKKLLNFDASSWPQMGSLLMGISTTLAILAGILKHFSEKKMQLKERNVISRKSLAHAAVISMSFIVLTACSTGPKTIYYGEESCHSCKMTIVDQRYAAQLVTQKGKTYNFDAIECMLHFKEAADEKDFRHQLVATFDQPGVLSEVNSVTFVHSKKMPSPMGLNVTAFKNADKMGEIGEGTTFYTWERLLKGYKNLNNNTHH